MLQKAFCLQKLEELDGVFEEVCALSEYHSSKSILLKIVITAMSSAEAEKISQFIYQKMPEIQIVGFLQTSFGENEQPNFILNFNFFESSDITLFEYGADHDCIAWGKALGERIQSMPQVKGVEIYFAGTSQILADFLNVISDGNEELPFYGVMVESNELYDIQQCCNLFSKCVEGDLEHYWFTSDAVENGIVVVLYAGEELHVRADYLLGWNPLGRYLTVSGVDSNYIVSSIDGMPAVDIYKKYLNVVPDDYFIFNICEFPLLMERNGGLIARVPPAYNFKKQLYFAGNIQEGDRVQLSYANPQKMIHETCMSADELRMFAPEGIHLTICGNRTLFLQEKAETEIDVYKKLQQDLIVQRGRGEIFCFHGQGGVLNSALVAVAYREGDIDNLELPYSCTCDTEDRPKGREIIPLADRLSAFIDTMTQELMESNRELKSMALEAKAASRAKSQFLSNMSHEIRTPINAILGMDEILLRECKDPVLLEYAENIRGAGVNLLGLVNDILDFSKIEAGKMDIIPVEYELGSVLNDLVNMIRNRAEKKGLALNIDSNENLPSYLYGDEIRIKQAVTNILTNAVKYTEKGSVTMAVDFEKLDEKNILLKFSIQDTGIGIKEEDKQKLFHVFERIEEKRNRTIEGTGLGMSITNRLLQLMDSKLKVESIYGEGSTFSFGIRQKVVKWKPIGNFQDAYRRSLSGREKYQESFIAPSASILVVDDTPMNIKVVKGLLKQTQIQIDMAESGQECLNMAVKKKYDIIFLDHRMPGMDGIETLAILQEMGDSLNHETPVIALTANAISGAREQYLAAGFTDYLTKPINSMQLEIMIVTYLPKEKVLPVVPEENEEEEKTDLPEWLVNSGLDTQNGVLYCGSTDGYLEAVEIFADSIDEMGHDIKYFQENGNIKNYTIKVHALKSSSRIIGASELSERAKKLEEAGNNGDWDTINNDTPKLLKMLQSYGEALRPIHQKKENENTNLPEIEPEQLAEAYAAMKEISSSFDYDSMMFIFKSLEEYRIPDAEQERFQQLKSATEKPDWETVMKLLENVG